VEGQRKKDRRRQSLGLAAGLLLLLGPLVSLLAGSIAPGIVTFALGAVLFAVWGYRNAKDKVVAGALIFVAAVAVAMQAVVYLLGP
jgi:hypothetical protein